MARHKAPHQLWPWGAAAAALLFFTAALAWSNYLSIEGSTVAGNVTFAGVDLSGVSMDDAARVVESRAEELLGTPISLVTGGDDLVATAEELGFSYETSSVLDNLTTARYVGSPIAVLFDWSASFFNTIEVAELIVFDADVARTRLATAPEMVVVTPVEPVLAMDGTNYLYVIAGVDGLSIDIDDLVARIGDIDLTEGPQTIGATQVVTTPAVTDSEAEATSERLNGLTEGGMEVLVGFAHKTLTTAALRRHLRVQVSGGQYQVEFDMTGLQTELESAFDEPVGPFEAPLMDVFDGDVVVVGAGDPPPVCCDPSSVRRAAEGILAGGTGPWRLEPRTSDNPEWVAWSDGSLIVDKVGEFTTPHACCQARVTNIQLMADIVRGIYLLPGQSVSLNEYVGARTREKGFVAAGAIRSGRMTAEVGGGVSQFATTIFNAAYFAGLDFDTYRSHSIYFSRYPYGREATISNPSPDLSLNNTSDYPVLIWTSYSDTSITVTMYSTKNIDVVELGQRVSRRNKCTHVETDRQRTYLDGSVVIDTFEANYRPGNGIDCNGNQIPTGT
ncbi:MAG: VanW family protein [Acidimicrobiia bacterium]